MLLAVCQEFDVDVDPAIIPRIASGFAGGMGNTGAVCGAVTGSVMALGLKLDQGETLEDKLRALGKVAEFRRRFEAELGSIHCHELTGMDLTTEEGLAQFMASDVPQKVCFPAVAAAYRLVVQMVNEAEGAGSGSE